MAIKVRTIRVHCVAVALLVKDGVCISPYFREGEVSILEWHWLWKQQFLMNKYELELLNISIDWGCTKLFYWISTKAARLKNNENFLISHFSLA